MNDREVKSAIARYSRALEEIESRTSRYSSAANLVQTFKLAWQRKLSLRQLRLLLEHKPYSTHLISSEHILELLKARDAVQLFLEQDTPESNTIFIQTSNLDKRLKTQAKWVVQFVTLGELRTSFHPADNAWWWYLDQQFGFWWKFLSALFLAVSLGLIGDIAPKFLAGGVDFIGTLTIASQGAFALLAGGSIFSGGFGQQLTKLFPRRVREEWGTVLALSLTLFLIVFHLSLARIGDYYRDRGHRQYTMAHLASAEANYQQALALNPDDGRTHYYLGNLYEELHDLPAAEAEYQVAIGSGSLGAYNNMSRLYILGQEYDSAAILLRSMQSKLGLSYDPMLHFGLLKNLGWTRLEQGLLAEDDVEKTIFLEQSRSSLKGVLSLASNLDLEPSRLAPAHCLMAQVMEATEGNEEEIRKEWSCCLLHSETLTPEESVWVTEAQKRLVSVSMSCNGN